MKALPHYQEFFTFVARMQRWLRQGGNPVLETVKRDVWQHIERLERASRGDPLLRDVFKRVRLPIIFFVDHVVVESNTALGEAWRDKRMAFEENELAGDEKFFDLTDELLGENTPVANEALGIIYNCLGLGFTGWYANQPEHIRELMETIAQRLSGDFESLPRLSPEAYQPLDTRNLIVTARSRIGLMLLAFFSALVIAMCLSYLVFFFSTNELREALQDIVARERFLYPNAQEGES